MMERAAILDFLRTASAEKRSELFRLAEDTRRRNVGDAVHLRGLVELSNYCRANCAYCGIRVGNTQVRRYRMEHDEILPCVRLAERLGYGTVVFQAGESEHFLPGVWVEELIREIRKFSGIAITLSLGERSTEDYQRWFRAGANRYLLRFETSNPALFRQLHPGHPGLETRKNALLRLRQTGYEIGSGVMVGIPGQTWEMLAEDIQTFVQLDLDMIGVGPFLPHPETPLGRGGSGEVPNDEETTLRVVALSRLVCPRANIPSTTALAVVDRRAGHEHGLACGANVIMPNVTPEKYRQCYEIYPSKATTCEAAERYDQELKTRIRALGREVGAGPGTSPHFLQNRNKEV
ncbi:MAG: [FeFe] hydrogenase H-cluster radical SAM maturase HydE [Planctomycetia bacterium]|nr:[FeFe] hydrogenase H-cluster radical SAM maturase HydE [Planctomycetia bacterium]